MQKKTYDRAVKPDRLGPELVAALPALVVGSGDAKITRYQLSQTATTATLEMPDDVDMAVVDSVLAAHDGTTPTAAEQQAAQDATDLSTLKAQATAAYQQITNNRAQVANGQTNLADAAWTPLTAAQKTERLRVVLQGLLTAFDNALAREQQEIKALAVLVRRGS